MPYVALYRKFRPPTFDDVKGQDHIVTTLKNQILSDRLGHAYLFCGTRGTGKTSVAKILARAVNCEHPVDGNPCGECETCKAIAEGRCMDVVEIDAASNNGVDSIREIIDEVSYSPTQGRKKVYIIDEVHMLSTGAFNALLKTLEEPPSYVIFILATTEVQKIPITILSRCQRYDFHRITIDTITDRLREVTTAENIDTEDRALRYVARAADGSMRDSLSLLDQCIAFNYGEKLTYDRVLSVLGAVDTEVFGRFFNYLNEQNTEGVLNLFAEIVMQGRELTQFVSDFVWYLRNLMLSHGGDNLEDIIDVSSEKLEELRTQAQSVPLDTILRYITIFSELSSQIRYAAQKRILIEMTLIRMCRPQMDATPGAPAGSAEMEDRLSRLEQQVEKNQSTLRGIREGQIKVAAAAGASGAGNGAAPAPKPVIQRAVPEDIQNVANNWRKILSQFGDGWLKTTLGGESLTKLCLGESSELAFVFSDEGAVNILNGPNGYREDLERELTRITGREIPVSVKYLDAEADVTDYFQTLQGKMGIQIETVDE